MAEWLKAADCKSVHASVRRFESYSLHHFFSHLLLYFKEKLVIYRNSQGFVFCGCFVVVTRLFAGVA